MGVIFSLVALISWGVGDFLIQRSARKFGSLIVLFYITLFAAIVFLPFVFKDIVWLINNPENLWVLILASLAILFGAIFQFKALTIGKISVIEPISALEIPLTALLAAFIIQENITTAQTFLIILLLLGIFLLSIQSFSKLRTTKLEIGVWYAVIATVIMGAVNFLFAVSSRTTSPLLIMWFSGTFCAICLGLYFIVTNNLQKVFSIWHKGQNNLMISVLVLDNLAWLGFSLAVLFIPIAIATGISESYIAISVLLGLLLNKEKLQTHQFFGLALALVAVIILAYLVEK